MSAAAQQRHGRWQEVFVDGSGFVTEAPARIRATEARGDIAELYHPSEGLEWIDQFAADVTSDVNRVRTWRAPVSEPAPWYTAEMREAIAAAVTPLVPGMGEFPVELERRFIRALTYLTALDERVQLGHAVGVADVTALSVIIL